jgi:hypothetical protein
MLKSSGMVTWLKIVNYETKETSRSIWASTWCKFLSSYLISRWTSNIFSLNKRIAQGTFIFCNEIDFYKYRHFQA